MVDELVPAVVVIVQVPCGSELVVASVLVGKDAAAFGVVVALVAAVFVAANVAVEVIAADVAAAVGIERIRVMFGRLPCDGHFVQCDSGKDVDAKFRITLVDEDNIQV